MHSCPRTERIEQMFQRAEQESERRAQAEGTGSTAPTGRRRGGSVSVSRFGQSPDPSGATPSPSPAVASVAASVVQKQSFYSVQPQGSADSLASATSEAARAQLPIEEESSVRMDAIAGRQSIGKAFSQRLSRSRTASRDMLAATPSANGLCIGVSVTEATVEVEVAAEALPGLDDDASAETGSRPGTGRSMAYASSGSPTAGASAKLAVPSKKERRGSWFGKAKDSIAMKLRRRSTAALAPSVP